ncbi:MAG: radical SAM protein [Chloroflexi bacterium]|nr:radical SAM protein [Chloroflexota bacterium]MBU1747052.1 radical SAM protein [Chloroflexota bacterium]
MILTLSAPVLYALELTPACTNRCRGCFNSFDRARAPLPLADWRAILDCIAPHAHRIKLTGGEPTLYPDLPDLVAALQERDLAFSIFTNGDWADPAALLRLLGDTPQFRGFLISLHGATPAAHEFYTQVPGSYQKAVSSIRAAARAGLPVVVSTVLHRHNLDQLGAIVALAGDLGAHHVAFNRYLGPPLADVQPADEALRRAVTEIDALRAAGQPARFGNCVPHCFVASSASGCLSGVAYCTIDPWGNLRPCNHATLQCGNLLEQSLADIWQGEAMNRWRASIPPACHTCAAFSQCHGGCRALAWEQGLPHDPLMTGPVMEPPAPERISLDPGWRPIKHCVARPESFGYVLMQGNRIVPVTAAQMTVLEACDGQIDLAAILQRFGAAGVDLVGALAEKGLVQFEAS